MFHVAIFETIDQIEFNNPDDSLKDRHFFEESAVYERKKSTCQ